jgi:hypothetical protein
MSRQPRMTAASGVNASAGFSLPEVLVSVFFAVIFGAMLHEFNRAVFRSVQIQTLRTEAQETARIAVETMARELRAGGYSGSGTPLAPLRLASADAIEIISDLNGDGDTDDANEVIAYSYDETRQAIMRATGNAAPQPMVDHVPAGGFNLSYRDDQGELHPDAADASARARVREVEIKLSVQYYDPISAGSMPVMVNQTASARLRNGAR